MEEYFLKDIVYPETKERIINWDFEEGKGWRVYFKPRTPVTSKLYSDQCNLEQRIGFYFCTVEWCGNNLNEPQWSENTMVEILYHGVSYFDGVRHMWLGDEQTNNCAYVNYPDLERHIKILGCLRGLEDKFCSEIG